MNIGKQILYYRKQCEYSQKELAALVFLSERTIGHYEKGTRIPPVDKLELIANALEVDVQDLVGKTKKRKDDWIETLIENTKHNMDERRFKIIMKRAFGVRPSEIRENEKYIDADGRIYPKSLAEKLLHLTNAYVNFSEICFYQAWGWFINGYVGENRFEIKINHTKNHYYLVSLYFSHYLEDNYLFCKEIKQMMDIIQHWFVMEFSHDQKDYRFLPQEKAILNYSLSAFLYQSNVTKENLLQRSLIEEDFYNDTFTRLTTRLSCQTVADLLQLSKEDTMKAGIHHFEISSIQRDIQLWFSNRTYHTFAVPKKTLQQIYPNVLDIPTEEAFTNKDMGRVLRMHSYTTLGELIEATKFQIWCFFDEEHNLYPLTDDDLEEMIMELQTYGLSLKEGDEDEWE